MRGRRNGFEFLNGKHGVRKSGGGAKKQGVNLYDVTRLKYLWHNVAP